MKAWQPSIHSATEWSGIFVQHDSGHYWIMDAHGLGEEYVGTTYPTDARINTYRERVAR